MKKLVLFPLVVAFLIVAILGSSHTTTAQAQASLEGTVTVNGDLAPADVEFVAVLKDGPECGRATTETSGTYSMSLSQECQVGETLFFRPAATEDQATTTAVIEEGTQAVTIVFEGLSVKSLLAMGVVAPLTEEEPPKEEPSQEPAISEAQLFWLVLVVSVLGMALLGLTVVSMLMSTEAARRGGPDWERRALTYRRQIEGMVLILVIVAIIILGISEKIGDQGLVSVLAAIVGYAVARASAPEGK